MKTENGVTTYYVYGRGLIGEEVNGAFKTYHFDYRGSTVALTDSTGNVTDTFEYDTYGSMTARTGTTVTPFLYNGRDGVMTDENGLVYMRARYYSPTLKRFINADVVAGSITNSITLNRYAYANGNPVSNVDPFGLSAERGNIMSNDRYTDVNGYYEWLNNSKQDSSFWDGVVYVVKEANDAYIHYYVNKLFPASEIIKFLHYNRNYFNNTNYSEQELIDMGYEALGEDADKFHQNNQKDDRNRKYVIGDWFSSEIVYYSDGTINLTPEDEGTFNVYSGDNGFLNVVVHGTVDVIPYMIWGNNSDDSTTIIDRIIMIGE